MTPPVTPKIVPAPVYSPSSLSAGSSGSEAKSMPAALIMRASSRVVSTTSVSWVPVALMNSSRAISCFFAVQGMIEVTWIFVWSTPFLSAQ